MKKNIDFIDEYREAYSAMDERAEEVMKAYGKELDLLAIGRAKVIKEQHLTYEEEIEEALDDWRAENLFYCVYEDRHNNLYSCTINGVRWNKERGCIEAHVVEDNGGYIDEWMPASHVYDQDAVYMSILTYIDGETEPDYIWVFTAHQACDDQVLDTITEVFATEEAALKHMQEFVGGEDGELAFAEKRGWKIEANVPDYFQAYEDGYYCGNHTEAEIKKLELKR